MESIFLWSGSFGLLPLVLVFAILASRVELDPTGRRAYATYLAAVNFVAIFIVLISGFMLVNAATQLAFHQDDHGSYGPYPSGDSQSNDLGMSETSTITKTAINAGTGEGNFEARRPLPPDGDYSDTANSSDDFYTNSRISKMVLSSLIMLAALGIFMFHRRQQQRLAAEPDYHLGAAWRIQQTYANAVSFVSVLIVAFAGAIALYGLFQAIAPGIAQISHRSDGLTQFISAGALSGGAFGLFLLHWKQVERPKATVAEPSSPTTATGVA